MERGDQQEGAYHRMTETMKQFGDRLLGPEREHRRVRALASLVAAQTWSETTFSKANQVSSIFLDVLEARIAESGGGRKRTLLEVYDAMLGAIERATSEAKQ